MMRPQETRVSAENRLWQGNCHCGAVTQTIGNISSTQARSYRDRVRAATRKIEAQIILETLEKNRWNRRRTAEELRISYRLLMYKMKNCNLRDIPGIPAAEG